MRKLIACLGAGLLALGVSPGAAQAASAVSVRTVESHLAAAYRKLAINSRQGLVAFFG